MKGGGQRQLAGLPRAPSSQEGSIAPIGGRRVVM